MAARCRPDRALALALVLAVTAGACRATDIKHEVHVHEQALLLPEAIAPAEPFADRVVILHRTGRALTFEDAVIGRQGDDLVVSGGEAPIRVPLADARAVQIERTLSGLDRARLLRRHEAPPDVVVEPAWGVVLGVVGLLTATIFVVTELDD